MHGHVALTGPGRRVLRAVFLAALVVAAAACFGSDDPEATRAVDIAPSPDNSGAGWVDIYVPDSNTPGATHVGCYIEPGFSCANSVDPAKDFEIVATATNTSTFVRWSQDCTGSSMTCDQSAGPHDLVVHVTFDGDSIVVPWTVRSSDATTPGILRSDQGHIFEIPSEEPIPEFELEVPANGEVTIEFSAQAGRSSILGSLNIWQSDGSEFATSGCGPSASTCSVTIAWDDLTTTPGPHRFDVFVDFLPDPDADEYEATGFGPFTLTIDPPAAGDCGDDPPYQEEIQGVLVDIGEISAAIILGISGADGPYLGTWDPLTGQLFFAGTKTGPQGRTQASFLLEYNDLTDRLSGREEWNYTGDDGTCFGAVSTVSGRRSIG